MKNIPGFQIGRGACPPELSLTIRAVGGNGPCLLAALLLLAANLAPAAEMPAPASAAPKKDACCEEKSAAPKDAACCKEEVPAGKFSTESIYQLESRFTTDSGKQFSLGELRGRPVVLDMFFASCGYACPLTVTDMLAIQGRLPAERRGQTVFVLVSFDIARDTPAALAKYRAERGLDGQWILLHGDDAAVRELAALLGVKFKQEADGAFSHSNIVTILNREGEIAHQRLGLKGGLDEAAAALGAVFKK